MEKTEIDADKNNDDHKALSINILYQCSDVKPWFNAPINPNEYNPANTKPAAKGSTAKAIKKAMLSVLNFIVLEGT